MASLEHVYESADRAGRAYDKVVARWVLDSGLPLPAVCVLLTLSPDGPPRGAGDVAREMGISVEHAARALHDLRKLGYAHEKQRRYEPTEVAMKAHEGLNEARREAVLAFLGTLDREELEALAGDLRRRKES